MRTVLHFILWLAAGAVTVGPAHAEELSSDQIRKLSLDVMYGSRTAAQDALARFVRRGHTDVLATLLLSLRYIRTDKATLEAVSQLTGKKISDWKQAMLWQEEHPEVQPHATYRDLKLTLFGQIDPNFHGLLGGDRSDPANMDIRLEEIVWGGVGVDGIPSLDKPKMVPAAETTYLLDTDLVFGVSINGDLRAYPLRIMGWHEMLNDVVGGIPVALAYCTLCGSGILYETQHDGRKDPFRFGSSGLLFRSNKLMFDRETKSLWNQFTGKPVVGPLRGSGIELNIRPVTITTWKQWKKANPETKVLDINTGYSRDYGSGVVYRDYFSSPKLMFPAVVRNETEVARKDFVFGVRTVGAAKAWPIRLFSGGKVINDAVGNKKLVLTGDAASRSVRAYQRENRAFKQRSSGMLIADDGSVWTVTEDALLSETGLMLPRVPGRISYWFAWENYLGVDSELYR